MDEILKFFNNYSLWVYLLLTFVLLIPVRSLVKTLQEKRALVFGLEREISHARVVKSLAGIVVIILLFISELFLVNFLIPTLPASSILVTATLNPLVIPPGMPTPGELNGNNGTPTGVSQPGQTTGCIPGQVMLSAPKAGQEILGKITLLGSANSPNFGFYKYEYRPQGALAWFTILAGNKAVIDGELGFWDTTELTPGDYELRLVVTNSEGDEVSACIVPVRLIK